MFTKEEVKAAKATRDAIIEENISELKSIYMAGEIVMWDECEQKNLHKAHVSGKRPSLNEVAQAADKYLEKVGRVERMDIIKWDFIEGIAWAIEYYQAAGVCSGEDKTT